MFNEFSRNSLGSRKKAEQVAQKAWKLVPAYRHYLEKQGWKSCAPFEKLSILDKKSYVLTYQPKELLPINEREVFTLFRSSGSSGNSFYWPQLRSAYKGAPAATRKALEKVFSINRKKTLVIVGLHLGGWTWGEASAWSLKNIALNVPYPFWVLCPGNNIDEIIKAICQLESLVDQIILLLVPSAISYLHLRAHQLEQALPLKKIRYVVSGEPFSESLRISFQDQAAIPHDIPFMLSLYGSADTGSLGAELLSTVALRKLFFQNEALAKELRIETPIPSFFHFVAQNTYLEVINGSLCVTRWQGIPLVRYNLYDRVSLYGWRELRQAILSSTNLKPEDQPWMEVLRSANNFLPDLIALTGRADSGLILGAVNLEEYMLSEAVQNEELKDVLTGLYRAKVDFEADRQYLFWDLEVMQGVVLDQDTIDRVYYSLIKALGRLKPPFEEDYDRIYSHWDNEPAARILRLNFLHWPSLSQTTETSIKQRGITQ